MAMAVLFIFCTTSFAGWLIYHKNAFRGKVIDAQTKVPIENAVVVVIYTSYPIISGPGGGARSIIHVKETLTDKDGEFHIPSYTTFIQPNSVEDTAEFIIFKPGYGSFPRGSMRPEKPITGDAIEFFFSNESFGIEGEIILSFSPERKGKGTYGMVELPLPKTLAERRANLPGYRSELREEKIPIFFEVINEERKNIGLQGKVK